MTNKIGFSVSFVDLRTIFNILSVSNVRPVMVSTLQKLDRFEENTQCHKLGLPLPGQSPK